VCLCLCMRGCVCTCTCLSCLWVCVHVYMRECACVFTRNTMCMCAYCGCVCMYTCVNMHVCLRVIPCACVHTVHSRSACQNCLTYFFTQFVSVPINFDVQFDSVQPSLLLPSVCPNMAWTLWVRGFVCYGKSVAGAKNRSLKQWLILRQEAGGTYLRRRGAAGQSFTQHVQIRQSFPCLLYQIISGPNINHNAFTKHLNKSNIRAWLQCLTC